MSLLDRAVIAGLFTLAGIMGAYEMIAPRFRVNIEASMPLGVYWFVPGPVSKGDIVQSCLPKALAKYALQHRYLTLGGSCPDGLVPIVKVIAATSADSIDVSHTIAVNGETWPMSAIRKRDSSGHPVDLHLPVGRYRCATNQVFLMGQNPRSWDSRYWGCVPQSTIAGRWLPVPNTSWIASTIIFISQEHTS